MEFLKTFYQDLLSVSPFHLAAELGGIIILIGAGVWLDLIVRNHLRAKDDKTKPTQRTLVLRTLVSLSPVFRPILAFIFVHLMYFGMENFKIVPLTYNAVHQLLLAWLLIKAIRIMTKQKVATWLIAGFILPMTLLSIAGLWEPLLAFLDSLAINVATYKITVYKVLEVAFVITLLFWAVGRITSFIEGHIRSTRLLSVANRSLVTKLLQIALYIFAFMLSLDILGIDLTALAVFSGALGVGLGFGLQKITSNFISGLILLFEKSIKTGDMVELADGTYGIVKHISARFTLIRTYDGKEIMVPNEDFITQQVVNWTHSDSLGRLQQTIGVAYGSDLKQVRELVFEAINEHPDTLDDAENQCNLVEFGESSINFLMRFWLNDFSKGRRRVMGEVLMAIWEKFEKNNIEIPFPQRDLNLKGPIVIQQKASKAKSTKK